MSARELFLLSPYQFPGQNNSMIGTDEVADFLNGYSTLWHPAALRGALGPPQIASPYDHDQPVAGRLYCVPENPPSYLPEDWEYRVNEAGAATFRSTADRDDTITNLMQALRECDEQADTPKPRAHVPTDMLRAFFGIGLGYVVIDALYDAMEHEKLLAKDEFWQHVQDAVSAVQGDGSIDYREKLRAAAELLLSARQVLYPVDVHLLDLMVPDPTRLAEGWPSLDRGMPLNVIAASRLLERLREEQPALFDSVRERVTNEQIEICGGGYVEREDPVLPLESQLWNLLHGQAVARELFGTEIRVFARKRFGFHPGLPQLLSAAGLTRALLLTFDDGGLPSYQTTVVNWPAADGRQVDAFTRAPYPAHDANTYFHLTHYLHKTIMQDHAATLAFQHIGSPAPPWYGDLLELTSLAPVLGQWTTFTHYFNDVMAGEQLQAGSPDEFHVDYLSERCDRAVPRPVSAFPCHALRRRRLDTAWTLAALQRAVAGKNDSLRLTPRLSALEDRAETLLAESPDDFSAPEEFVAKEAGIDREIEEMEKEAGEALAGRLLVRASENQPGYLLLNPCSFARRIALELAGADTPLPVQGVVKACQIDAGTMRLVVEVPALGFAWIPRSGPPGTQAMAPRMRLADGRHVRNEFFEAEIDPTTGGLRGLLDHRTRVNRLGQQLVFHPGSTMRASEVKVTVSGAALGEVVSEGTLHGEQDQVLARFRQRFRAWLGRPVLEMRVEIFPEAGPTGYAWHSYYASRFAWRDERIALFRGVSGVGVVSTHTRPQTPDFLELRRGRQNTVLFPSGLPFHQRQGSRMVDVVLVPPGETETAFDLALALDRDNPMPTALGLISPIAIVPVSKGPPHIGDHGWLFHLDAPNVVVTSLRAAADGADIIIARLLECMGQGGTAEWRCARDPMQAALIDEHGDVIRALETRGDVVSLEMAAHEWAQVRVSFA